MATAQAPAGRSYGGRSPEERRLERHERLVAAAIGLYGSRGYQATPIVDVCREARVTPRHFYELFEGSEDLLLVAYDTVIAEQMQRIGEALEAASADLEARIRAGVRAAAELWRDDAKARLVQQEILGVSPRLEARRTEVLGGFAELIASEVRRSDAAELPDAELLLAGHILGGGLNEALFAWRLTPRRSRPPLERVAEGAARIFLAALQPRTEGTT